jgi:hypothetical protein
MGIAVYGLPRSGTTLVSDLLTVPGHAIVMSEPDLYKSWNRSIARRLHTLVESVGVALPGGVPQPEDWGGSYAHYIRTELAPRLAALDLWGMKCVDFSDRARLFEEFPPAKLILCLRDLRDTLLSGIDRICRMPLIFRSSGYRRDEAWVFSALCYNAWELMAMREQPHLALRYEDVATDPAILERIAAYAGLERLDPARNNLAAAGWHRKWEVEKHGDAISAASVGRFDREPDGPIKSLAMRLSQLVPEYADAFGYPAPALPVADHDFRPAQPGANPIRFLDTEQWDWRGPAGIEPAFARRRARRIAARNIKGRPRVLDLGGGSRAMAGMLPKAATHILADNIARADDVRVADIYRGELPAADDIDLVLALDVLEYVADLPAFLGNLRAAGKPAFVSYHATDDSAATDRAPLGWRNAHDRAAIQKLFEGSGFAITARWAFDGAQSIFSLRPR